MVSDNVNHHHGASSPGDVARPIVNVPMERGFGLPVLRGENHPHLAPSQLHEYINAHSGSRVEEIDRS